MPLHHGPRLPKTDQLGLVWDIDNPKSWKGGPTTNLFSSSNFSDTTYWGIYGGTLAEANFVGSGPYNIPFYEMIDNSTSSYVGRQYTSTIPATPDTDYTLSVWIRVNPSENGRSHFRLSAVGSGGLYSMRIFHSDGTIQLARNDANFTTLAQGNRYLTWNGILYSQCYLSFTTTTGSITGLTTQLLVGHDPDFAATVCTGYFGGPQLETGNVLNRWMDGTRTETECLFDLTRKHTFDLTDVIVTGPDTFEFSGSTSIGTLENLPNDYSSFTVSVWAYPERTPIDPDNDYRFLVSSNVASSFILIEQTDAISFRVPGIDTNNWTAGIAPNDTYTMITCVYDDSGIRKIYTNGELKGTDITVTSGPAVLGNLQFGRSTGIHAYEGKMFSGYFWNVALTDDEVKELFQLQRKRFGL